MGDEEALENAAILRGIKEGTAVFQAEPNADCMQSRLNEAASTHGAQALSRDLRIRLIVAEFLSSHMAAGKPSR